MLQDVEKRQTAFPTPAKLLSYHINRAVRYNITKKNFSWGDERVMSLKFRHAAGIQRLKTGVICQGLRLSLVTSAPVRLPILLSGIVFRVGRQ
jgi:hypothetical protein